ncbi:hypothetical protein D3C85_1931810 [compost metagenome]
MEYPRPFQTAMMISAGFTVAVSCSQLGPSMPSRPTPWLMRPKSPLNAHCHRMATEAIEEMTGR